MAAAAAKAVAAASAIAGAAAAAAAEVARLTAVGQPDAFPLPPRAGWKLHDLPPR